MTVKLIRKTAFATLYVASILWAIIVPLVLLASTETGDITNGETLLFLSWIFAAAIAYVSVKKLR